MAVIRLRGWHALLFQVQDLEKVQLFCTSLFLKVIVTLLKCARSKLYMNSAISLCHCVLRTALSRGLETQIR